MDGLADGAYQALISGRAEEHDKRIMDVGRSLAQKVDCIVLAQASMMRMQQTLSRSGTASGPVKPAVVCGLS